jgi:gas vesicle protein
MKAFLAGLGIGIGAGILFAPESGEASRRKLQIRLTEWYDALGRDGDTARNDSALHDEPSGADATQERTEFPPKKDQAREVSRSGDADFLNTVTREELSNVNGIGPVLADKIISTRPYSSRRELVERGIIPQSVFEELDRELDNRQRRSA